MRLGCFLLVAICASTAHADIDPLSGIDFVTVGAVGNTPWAGDGTIGDRAVGRGQVNYEYKIGRFEVTTSQWVEFFNAAYDRPVSDRLPHLLPPDFWGAASTTPNTPGGLRWMVPAGNELIPVGDISWRMAAIYCNWLHNGKSLDRAAFLNGAYDVSTFGDSFPEGLSDQRTHHPSARYWIPTWDEWLKAAHYDPSKQNSDGSLGGWWRYANMNDVVLTYGPPGVGQANAGPFGDSNILLGSYPTELSPWGLLDTAGGMREWTEEVGYQGIIPTFRRIDGSAWPDSISNARAGDRISFIGGDHPSIATLDYGFRIASSVPCPSTFAMLVVASSVTARRRRLGGLIAIAEIT